MLRVNPDRAWGPYGVGARDETSSAACKTSATQLCYCSVPIFYCFIHVINKAQEQIWQRYHLFQLFPPNLVFINIKSE